MLSIIVYFVFATHNMLKMEVASRHEEVSRLHIMTSVSTVLNKKRS